MNWQFGGFFKNGILLFITVGILPTSDSANDKLQAPTNVNCACPSELLTFTCNIIGGGNTLWNGTTFHCASNEIMLRHSQFSLPAGTSGSCNNGAITGRSVGVTNGCYSSELNVTVSPDFSSRTIQCIHDGSTGLRIINITTLNVVTALDPPGSVQLMDIQNGQAIIGWAPVDSCAPVQYTISSNCSTCSPTTTNLTTSSCSIFKLTAGDNTTCIFSIRSVICENQVENSSTAMVTFQAQASSVNVIPYYSASDKSLTKLTVRGTNLTIVSSDSADIFITEYSLSYTDPTTGSVVYSTNVSTCGQDVCVNDVSLPSNSSSLLCPSSTITITADNGFRQKLLSDPITIACTNQFVDVQYNPADSTISCTFLNQMDTSTKSCIVTYNRCGQNQTQTVLGKSSSALPNNVTLQITPHTHGSYCYTVTASNSNLTVVVEGILSYNIQGPGDSSSSNTLTIIAGVVGASLFIIVLIIVLIVMIIIVRVNHRKTGPADGSLQMNVISRLKLKLITDRSFKKVEIGKNCKLRDFIEYEMTLKFKRGHVYYEFTHEKENISEDRELIFMDKKTGEYFSPSVGTEILYETNLLGEGVQKSRYKKYRVFVQSIGSGARHLPAKSLLLYEQIKTKPWNPEETPLQQIISNHFSTTVASKGCTVEQFQRQNIDEREVNRINVFVEYSESDDLDMKKVRDMILMDKKTKKLFTGPTARSNPRAYLQQYKVFMLQYGEAKSLNIKPGKSVLHQSLKSMTKPQFYVLEVDEDNVQMAKFIKDKLGEDKFENGKAFYEFTVREEDFLFYKDVVLMPKTLAQGINVKQDGIQIFELISSIKRFYLLSKSVPGVGIKPQVMIIGVDEYRVFVQSTSQGSRCLKSGTLLLYKV